MSKLVTAAQMAELEQAAERAGTPTSELMERAGLAAAQEAWMSVGAVETRPILVLVGPGNNGGDALVAARQLAGWGATVRAYLLRPRDANDAQWTAMRAADVPAMSVEDDPGFSELDALLGGAALVVDGLLGTGQKPATRPIDGDLAEILSRVGRAKSESGALQVLALDLPTGVDADSGFCDPFTVAADITITFEHPKVGLFTMPGNAFAGRVIPVEIGIPADAAQSLPYEELRLRDAKTWLSPRAPDGHKRSFGMVIVAGGSRRYPGALRMAGEAAARSGAGLTAAAMPDVVQPALAGLLPDVVHEPLPSAGDTLDAAAAPALLRAIERTGAEALLVGPGLDLSASTRAFVRDLVAGLGAIDDSKLATVVIDADALNALAELPAWWEGLSLPRILTPHPGEMARLIGRSSSDVQADRLAVATEYAARTDSVVVLKGACTIVAAPDGRARISGVANAMLAHAGTGDVLAGLVAGLAAQGLPPFEAASAAVWVHAEAGRLVSEVYGSAAGIASDLLRALPDARKLLDD